VVIIKEIPSAYAKYYEMVTLLNKYQLFEISVSCSSEGEVKKVAQASWEIS
jgi:hypothetical protein